MIGKRNSDQQETSTRLSPSGSLPGTVLNLFLGWAHRSGAALIVFLAFVAIWQLAVQLLQVHPIVLPLPTQVFQVAWEEKAALAEGFWATGCAAILGLLCSIGVGSLVAILFSQSRFLRTAFYPYVIFLQTVPIVAIAPLLITWFGYGFKTVVLVAAIISLFPIVSNVTTGLISVDDNLRDLFSMGQASRWQTLVKLRIPNAVSHLVLGMRISAGLAVIGAIVGEFFVGTAAEGFSGLGTLMTRWQRVARTDAIIAAVIASTLLGVVTLTIVNLSTHIGLRKWTASDGFESQA